MANAADLGSASPEGSTPSLRTKKHIKYAPYASVVEGYRQYVFRAYDLWVRIPPEVPFKTVPAINFILAGNQ